MSKSKGEGKILHSFDINIKNVRTDFKISVKNYNPVTKRITFEILNSWKKNIETLSIELETQESIVLIGNKQPEGLEGNEVTSRVFSERKNLGNTLQFWNC